MSDQTETGAQGAGATTPTPPDRPTIAELRDRAKALDVPGRTGLDRDELVAAIAQAEAAKVQAEAEASARAELEAAPVRTAFADSMGALFNTADVDRPATPEETGRPELVEVAEQRAAARKSRTRNR